MSEFLSLKLPGEAFQIWIENLKIRNPEHEVIHVQDALNRITAEDIVSNEALPPFTRSAMDGYAVKSNNTYGSSDSLPTYLKCIGEVFMGQEPTFSIHDGEAALIHTGGMLPAGADAVVMIENAQVTKNGEVEIQKGVAAGENILLKGEDMLPGQRALSAGVKIRPVEIGGLLALGLTKIKVNKKPRIGILSSGDEIIPPEKNPALGQVRDINSYLLAAIVKETGAIPILYGIIPDKADSLFTAMEASLLDNDMVIITAGSSASTRDLTSEVISKLAKPGVLVHGINIRPGKPTILAAVNQKPVIGLPGNPISAYVVAHLLAVPMIEHLLGFTKKQPAPKIMANLTNNYPSSAGREEWIPVKLIMQGKDLLAEPIFFKSNFVFNLSRADGLAYIAPDVTGLSAGDQVEVHLI